MRHLPIRHYEVQGREWSDDLKKDSTEVFIAFKTRPRDSIEDLLELAIGDAGNCGAHEGGNGRRYEHAYYFAMHPLLCFADPVGRRVILYTKCHIPRKNVRDEVVDISKDLSRFHVEADMPRISQTGSKITFDVYAVFRDAVILERL